MKKILLTKGMYALVDDADHEWLNRYKWYAKKSNKTYYAVRQQRVSKHKQATVLMHREILGLKQGDPREGDHRNHNGLDNQRNNLRIADKAQNQQNRTERRNSYSKYKGVSWNKRDRKWQVYIGLGGKSKYVGYYEDEKEAARAYDAEARKYFGEFANTNF